MYSYFIYLLLILDYGMYSNMFSEKVIVDKKTNWFLSIFHFVGNKTIVIPTF